MEVASTEPEAAAAECAEPAQRAVVDIDQFCSEQLALLALEREAEKNQREEKDKSKGVAELQSQGNAITKLHVSQVSTGLGGRVLLQLQPCNPGQPLPAHKLTGGQPVMLSWAADAHDHASSADGVMWRVSKEHVTVALDEYPASLIAPPISVQLRFDDYTHRTLCNAINGLKHSKAINPAMVSVLFGMSAPRHQPPPPVLNQPVAKALRKAEPAARLLNPSQEEAIAQGLSSMDVSVIHGPPGTGKTTTVVELVKRAVERGLKVLAVAPSNIAVDNMVERLAKHKAIKLVRLGHPARLSEAVVQHSLDYAASHSDAMAIVRDVRTEMETLLKKISSTRDRSERKISRTEARELRKEIRVREKHAVSQIVSGADVVLTTCTGAASKKLDLAGPDGFDLVVIDECAQALEASCWIALLRAKRCILAGDHCQLPPTILSDEASKGGLERTLMDRAVQMYGNRVVTMLDVQYRMHRSICDWSSSEFYNDKLVSAEEVAEHLLIELPNVEAQEVTQAATWLIDTSGCDCLEVPTSGQQSKSNIHEAAIVVQHCRALIEAGLTSPMIAVITPYNAQVDLIRNQLAAADMQTIEVRTVDGFQGREQEAIVLSLVRSNPQRQVGFLAEPRRLNVAITRARRHLAIVADVDTLGSDPFLGRVADYFSTCGEHRDAAEYGALPAVHSRHSGANKPNKSKQQEQKKQKKQKGAEGAGGAHKTERKGFSKPAYGAPAEVHSVEEAEEQRAQIGAKIALWQKGGSKPLEFDADLSSFGRKLVHEISEQRGLSHVSTGEGADRKITVSRQIQPCAAESAVTATSEKLTSAGQVDAVNEPAAEGEASGELEPCDEQPRAKPAVAANPFDLLQPEEEEEEEEAAASAPAPPKEAMYTCGACNKDVPTCHQALHDAHCWRQAREKRVEQEEKEAKQARKKEKNEAKLLESYKNDCCWKKGCNQKLTLMAMMCCFCNQKFCMAHRLPESHGCGEEAKAKARKGATSGAKPTPRNGTAEDRKRTQLKSQLQQKLGDASKARANKTAAASKKKGKKKR